MEDDSVYPIYLAKTTSGNIINPNNNRMALVRELQIRRNLEINLEMYSRNICTLFTRFVPLRTTI